MPRWRWGPEKTDDGVRQWRRQPGTDAGTSVGSGVSSCPASLRRCSSEPISIVGWICTTIGAVLLALVFAKLAGLVRGAGGPYAYTRGRFGDFAAFWIAWGYWIAIWAGNAAIAVAMVGYLAVFFPPLATNGLLGGADGGGGGLGP